MADEELEKIHGYKVDIQNTESESIRDLVRSWRDHESDFREMRNAVEKDSNRKIRLGNIVFEKKDGKFIIRKSSSYNY